MRRNYTWQDLTWTKSLLKPVLHQESIIKRRKVDQELSREKAEMIQEDDYTCAIRVPFGMGKVTDAGYDVLACISTEIKDDLDFVFEGDVTVECFLREPGPSNQESFGIFLRSTLSRNIQTGLYYANMAAVGGYYGRYNVFGRSGIETEYIDCVRNFFLYRKVNRGDGAFRKEPLHYCVSAEKPQKIHLQLSKRGDRLFARMTDDLGNDLLCSGCNGGEEEIGTGIACVPEQGYEILWPDLVGDGKKHRVYIGFFATGGSNIVVNKQSVRLLLSDDTHHDEKRRMKRDIVKTKDDFAAVNHAESLAPFLPLRIWYAAPDGKGDGDGTREKPFDINTAVRRCGMNETVCLLSGTYFMDSSLVIEQECSGTAEGRKCLSGEQNGTKVILDFRGRESSISICADYWIIENLTVTNGYGIQIEGSYNYVRNCVSFGNLETGILIRHHENFSPKNRWPSYNHVQSCVSYGNCDISECNADGFACKVASGAGNVFDSCIAFLNSDDGFDLYAKNRKTGAVTLINCKSYINGYKQRNGSLSESAGNGNGFKLGGSGQYVEHQLRGCVSVGNRRDGFTSNSNPYMYLEKCVAHNNGRKNISYGYYEGARTKHKCETIECLSCDEAEFDVNQLLVQLLNGLQ